MPKFKSGDWVTVGNDGCFTISKKYEVFSDCNDNLYLIDDDGHALYSPLHYTGHHQIKKTTPPPSATPPEEIQAHGRTYTLKPLPPHEFKFGDWARHNVHGVVFVVCAFESHECCNAYTIKGRYLILPKSELTYISTAEIPS